MPRPFRAGDRVVFDHGSNMTALPGATAIIRHLINAALLDVEWDRSDARWRGQDDGAYFAWKFDLVAPDDVSPFEESVWKYIRQELDHG